MMYANWIDTANRLGANRTPFFFLLDFEMRKPIVVPLSELNPNSLRYNFMGQTNSPPSMNITLSKAVSLNPRYVSQMEYSRGFQLVQHEQRLGNSFLCNLTFPTEILEGELIDKHGDKHDDRSDDRSDDRFDDRFDDGRPPADSADGLPDLKSLYNAVDAPYRLFADLGDILSGVSCSEDGQDTGAEIPRRILVFSPETFVQTHHGRMYTYPMKGTAFAEAPEFVSAKKDMLLSDPKEEAEHTTVVDLLRNDLGRVGRDVRVEDFRYIKEIPVDNGILLQASSRISCHLDSDWESHLGDILAELLPAGSVSGAPKHETCRIISDAELCPRGYYTGVSGVYNGHDLDSAVLIRYLEEWANGKVYFRSGGGITIYSDEQSEYRELMDKVRLPLRRNPGI